MPSILEQAKDEAERQELDRIKAETPSAFIVGGSFDGQKVTGGVTIQRTWASGWGATAYVKGWWEDAAVHGVTAGGEVIKKF